MRIGRSLAFYAFVLVAAHASTARAWNPLTAFVNKVKDVGHGIGSVVGAPFGGFVDALAQPTLHDAEGSLHRLIGDVDTALGGEIDRVGGLVTKVVGQVDTAVADRISQVDQSLAARIVQVKTGVDDSVRRLFDRIDGVIGRIDDVARKRIAQINLLLHDRILQVDEALNKDLAKVDDMLTKRIADLNALVANALQQADQIAQARIDQLDEVASKRIGNLDMVATKQTDSIEGAAIGAAAKISLVVFFALVLWWAFRKVGTGESLDKQVTVARGRKVSRLALQSLVVVSAVGVFLYLDWWLPRRTNKEIAALVKGENSAFAKARVALDMRDARYHEAQLQLLDPESSTHNHALLDKTDLIHTVFTRPMKVQSASSLRDLMQIIANLDVELPGDPDILVVKAFITWQVGGDRQDELDAAQLCAEAIQTHAAAPSEEFILANLAKHYIDVVLAQTDLTGFDPKQLQAASKLAEGMTGASPHRFEQAALYDAAVGKLRDTELPAYVAMLSAQADLQIALDKKPRDQSAVDKAREARNKAAQQIVDAWKELDSRLASETLAGDTVALAAFSLDDAVLSHALYYVSDGTKDGLTPPLATLDLRPPSKDEPKPAPAIARTDDKLDGNMRVKIAPLRIEWARRFAPLLSGAGQQVLAFQEAQRFKAFERRAHEFEVSYVGFLIKTADHAQDKITAELGKTAALDAAEMGLVSLETTLRTKIEEAHGKIEEDLKKELDTLEKRRAIRLL